MLNDTAGGYTSTKLTKGLQVLFYFLIANLIFDLLITLINSFGTLNYFSELLSFSIKNVLIFAIVLVVTLIGTIIPIVFGQRYKNWDEDKQTKIFFKVLTIISLSTITLSSILVYIFIYPEYTLLNNPFSVNNSNNFLLLVSPVWWFFSYNLGLILIFLLYIYLES